MIRELITWFKLHKITIYTWIFGILFAFQVANVCSYLARNTYPQAVIASTDDDAAWIVKRAMATRWYKDNGTAVYGPAFFRLVHTVQYFLGDTAAPEGAKSAEAWQRTAQYAVLMISLLSMAGTSLLIATLISGVWSSRFVIASALLAAFLSHPDWVEMLLRAHPDHLFTLVVLVAFVLTYKMLAEPSRKLWFVAAATVWGISVAVKLTTALWAFGFAALFVPPFTKRRFILAAKFLGLMVLGYFVIGFPQTIVVDRPVRIMLELNAYNQPMTWATVMGWLNTIGSQALRPLVVLFLAILFFGDERIVKPNQKGCLRLTAFVLLPFPLLITKNMIIPTNHYPIPFLTLCFALLALTGVHLALFRKIPYLLRAGSLFALVIVAGGFAPRALNHELAKQSKCKPEALEAFGKVKELEKSYKFWYDPYFPGDSSNRQSPHKVEWRKTWPAAQQLNITAVGLSRTYLTQFFDGAETNPWVQKVMPQWRDHRAFYEPFAKGDMATAPDGKVFKKLYSNACGHEIWVADATIEPPAKEAAGKPVNKKQAPAKEAASKQVTAKEIPNKESPVKNEEDKEVSGKTPSETSDNNALSPEASDNETSSEE